MTSYAAILHDARTDDLYWLTEPGNVSGFSEFQQCDNHPERNATRALIPVDSEDGDVALLCSACWNFERDAYTRYNRI